MAGAITVTSNVLTYRFCRFLYDGNLLGMAATWLDEKGGYEWSDISDGSALMDCLMQVKRNASCVQDPTLANRADGWEYEDDNPSWYTWATSSYGPWATTIDLPPWSLDPSDSDYIQFDI